MIAVIGLSHRSAPIEVRERLSFDKQQVPEYLCSLVREGIAAEAMLVSTCNRVELVVAGGDVDALRDRCLLALEQRSPGIQPNLYGHTGADAVRHLFRVASSLDSLVLGEPQILGQVKEAFEVARAAGTLGPTLNRTVPRALRAAKRVRHETSIGSGQVSVPSVAVELTSQIFGDLRDRVALLIGSGEMAETVARLLKAQGARILVLGRTAERVEELARAVGGEPRRWNDLRSALAEADVVISSTSAPDAVVDYDMVSGARRTRRGREQFYIDLAVPRDVDPRANSLDGVFIYNIDDLSQVVARTLSARSREAQAAENIIEQETRGFERWSDAEQATPAVLLLRNRLRRVFSIELSRTLRGRLKHLSAEDRAALTKMFEAAENRLLHGPTMRLRRAASERDAEPTLEELATALRELFGDDDDSAYEDEVRELEVLSVAPQSRTGAR